MEMDREILLTGFDYAMQQQDVWRERERKLRREGGDKWREAIRECRKYADHAHSIWEKHFKLYGTMFPMEATNPAPPR